MMAGAIAIILMSTTSGLLIFSLSFESVIILVFHIFWYFSVFIPLVEVIQYFVL
jgi:hypothetical protein